ncbi:MAG: N-(5'-phosphoribosyl)anthranilate isomerase [Cycloclasticus sp. symbiont of Bathymodiolus heckerae]|nr:MAG: N-(5'-phosphoribosyl)anthranilate isomerase [Cycloclasticus sp. symbiont of Bathymodiolus heckerae]
MSFRTRVKICGITQADNAVAAISAGADALGFVFYEPSPRYVNIDQAKNIFNKISPFINKVALFVNAEHDYVSSILNNLNIDVLQFHGDEDEAFCRSFNTPYLKAVRIQEAADVQKAVTSFASASGILVDAYDQTQYGGTGKTFNWDLLPNKCDLPIILAGGLNDKNIYQAIHATRPYAVDVSSGVEKSKGVKDHALIEQFMHEVKRADNE